jgi:DNA-binding transcriptional LysR family regulator
MNEIDLRLMRAAVAIADDLSFSRAATRLNISQPALTKQIHDLENALGATVFDRDHQKVELTDAGRVFVEGAGLTLAHHQRAIQAARSMAQGAEAVLNLGLSPYIDPWLTSVVSSVQLPLFPDLQLHFSSDYSLELIRKVDSGELDLALVVEGGQHGRLASFELTNTPFHVLLENESRLSGQEALTIKLLDGVPWILFARQVHPHLYERLVNRADTVGVTPKGKHHVTNAEHAAQLVRRTGGIAFLTPYGASRVASDGLTHLPLAEPDLRLRSVVVARIDAGRVVSEFVRATVKRVKKLSEPLQGRLPLTGS